MQERHWTAREATRDARRAFFRRAFARLIDIGFYVILTKALLDLVIRIKAEPLWRVVLLLYFLPIVLLLVLEPLFLSLFRTTPGKWLLGIRLTHVDSGRLPLAKAVKRTFHVFRDGLGWWFPFFNWFLLSGLRKRVIKHGEWPWDKDNAVLYRGNLWWRTALGVLGVVILFSAHLVIQVEKQLPFHRGAVSALEYVENINDLVLRLSPGYDAHMLPDGSWLEGEKARQDPRWIPLPKHDLYEEAGVLQEVSLVAEVRGERPISGFIDQKALAYVAFVGAAEGYSSLFMQNDEVRYLLADASSSFQRETLGIDVIQSVDYEGYEKEGRFLVPLPDTESIYSLDFRLRRRVSD